MDPALDIHLIILGASVDSFWSFALLLRPAKNEFMKFQNSEIVN